MLCFNAEDNLSLRQTQLVDGLNITSQKVHDVRKKLRTSIDEVNLLFFETVNGSNTIAERDTSRLDLEDQRSDTKTPKKDSGYRRIISIVTVKTCNRRE
jgi:hypothetical protein